MTAAPDHSERPASPAEAELARLYDETSARVYGLVLRVVRDPALAESVTRDVYLQAWGEQCDGAPAATAVGRLLVSAHRLAVEQARAEADAGGAVAPPVLTPVPDADGGSPLDRLTQPERRAVELAYLDGRTHTEVAALVAPGAEAHVLIRDGLRRLCPALPESA